jgi:anti-sigma regulatory factor (Ser/Thr protein kinase)
MATVDGSPCQAPLDGGTGAVSGSSLVKGTRASLPEHGSGVGTASSWLYVSFLEFCPLPTAVSCGRWHARHILHEWGLDTIVDEAALLVSELLTNAVNASLALEPPVRIALRLLADDHRLIIEAWDQCVEELELPAPRPDDDEHGRGLQVVAALSTQWGVRRPGLGLKVVWCELAVT